MWVWRWGPTTSPCENPMLLTPRPEPKIRGMIDLRLPERVNPRNPRGPFSSESREEGGGQRAKFAWSASLRSVHLLPRNVLNPPRHHHRGASLGPRRGMSGPGAATARQSANG